jgi:TM2 domain-containing membrane protein YozV
MAATPPHHISDVETWENPDRNYFIFVVLSVLLGFVGADHFYLRSFGTGAKKLVMNFLTLGLWYWWDLIQIFKDGKKVRREGLNSPFDWIRGIGRGVFSDESLESAKFAPKKSYLTYAFLAIFFGWLGMDKFYLGNTWQGIVKVISCFNIFLFLFGWLWVVWDAVHAFFMTDTILREGVTTPLPYSFIFSEPVKPDVFKVNQTAEPMGFLESMCSAFSVPVPSTDIPWKDIFTKLVVPTSVLTQAGLKAAGTVYTALPNPIPSDPPAQTGGGLMSSPAPVPAPVPAPAPAPVPAPVPAPAPTPVLQTGGGVTSGPGPVIAGVLSALVLAGGLKGFYDVIQKQYG